MPSESHKSLKMADKMDVDAVNGEREEETVGPAQIDVPPERSRPPSAPTHSQELAKLIKNSSVIINNFGLLRQAVDAFDSRFTLRALRSISTLRKSDRFAEAITLGVRTAFPKPNMGARKVLEEMLPDSVTSNKELNGVADESKKDDKKKDADEEQQLPEVWAYLGILVQVRDLLIVREVR